MIWNRWEIIEKVKLNIQVKLTESADQLTAYRKLLNRFIWKFFFAIETNLHQEYTYINFIEERKRKGEITKPHTKEIYYLID